MPGLNSLLVLLVLILVSPFLFAESQPRWELGAGVGTLVAPHYLGSDQSSSYIAPLPFIIYRGEKLQADRRGLRGLFYHGDNLDVNISVSGSLPVNNKDNIARRGMNDLDLMLELGPTAQYKLFQSRDHLLRFDLPVRGAFRLGNQFLFHQGWVANPNFVYATGFHKWRLSLSAGAVFSDRRYHGYFYNVDQGFVTSERGFYRAQSGYSASRFTFGLRRRFSNWFVGFGLRYYGLSGSENLASPLVKSKDYFSGALAFAYIFDESKILVDY